MVWNGLIVAMLLYTITFVPLEIAFLSEIENPIVEPFFKAFDTICDIIFAVDIFITFITAIEVPGRKPEVQIKKIVKSYVLGYFWIDFIATFPFDMVLSQFDFESNGEQKLARFVRLPRLSRLTRLFRLLKVAKFAKFSP